MRRVVVTGMGVVSPIGTGIEAFHRALCEARAGVDAIRTFDARSFPTRIAAEVKDLDLGTVAVPAEWKEALGRDRKSIFGISAARQALHDAFGEVPPAAHYPPKRIGLSCATGLEIFHLEDLVAHWAHDHLDSVAAWSSARALPAYSRLQTPSDLGARVIASEAGAGGWTSVNVSACAAGTQALGEGLHAIRDGVADCVIAGGYDSMINPLGVRVFCMLEAMSRSNELRGRASRPFDAHRDGFVLGEGAGFCVLEELAAARRRSAHIFAEVVGYDSTMDAYRVSDPAPDQAGAIACLEGALRDSGLEPEQIGYINAHGTATRKNDPAETSAIKAVFGAHARRIPISSTKSQIGHLIGAAGAVEFLASLLPLLRGVVPPTINLEHPDPECDLDYVPGAARAAAVHAALSSSFGFGGQNAAIILVSSTLGNELAARRQEGAR